MFDAANEDRLSGFTNFHRPVGWCMSTYFTENHSPIQSELQCVVEITVECLISEKVRVGDWPLGYFDRASLHGKYAARNNHEKEISQSRNAID